MACGAGVTGCAKGRDAVAKSFADEPTSYAVQRLAVFFRQNPAAAGLVELSPVRLSPDGLTATTYVGRSCGEHCRNAWRIAAKRVGERWTIIDLQWVRVPGT